MPDVLLDDVESHAEPVRLKEMVSVNAGLRCEYVVDREKERTQLHLFQLPSVPMDRKKLGEATKVAIEKLIGEAKLEWIPEVESWYVEIPRTMTDDGTATAQGMLAYLAGVKALYAGD